MRAAPLVASLLLGAAIQAQTGAVYSEPVPGLRLTLDVHPGAGPGPHPIAIVIPRADSYLASFLAPAGYTVFTVDHRYPPAASWREMAGDVRRAIRFIRHNAPLWNADPRRIALVGGPDDGYLANLVGVMLGDPDPRASDPVERASAAVQAVAAFSGYSDFRGQEPGPRVRAMLARDIEAYGEKLAFSGASPVMHLRPGSPPFLLLHGDRDEEVPLAQSTHWQAALQAMGVRCDLIIVAGGGHGTEEWHRVPGVREWEREMTDWLNAALGHDRDAGPGILVRRPVP